MNKSINQELTFAVNKLKESNIESAQIDSEILLSHILKKSREYLFTFPDKKITLLQSSHFHKLISKRQKNIPVAYLIGYKYFYNYKFQVNKNVLTPRPETEIMVGLALEHIINNEKNKLIIDIGTGSGCISISLANELKKKKITNHPIQAIDISKKALTIAKKNAKINNVKDKIKFLHGNLFEPIAKQEKIIKDFSELIILANLPYLTQAQIENSPSIKHEPKLALVAGSDGLQYYQKLFKQIRNYIKINSIPLYIICEIDPGHAKKIRQLAQNELSENKYSIKNDYSGKPRFLLIETIF